MLEQQHTPLANEGLQSTALGKRVLHRVFKRLEGALWGDKAASLSECEVELTCDACCAAWASILYMVLL